MFRLALLHDISGDAARKHVALGDIPARRDDELDLCLIGSFDEVTLDGRVEGARGEECSTRWGGIAAPWRVRALRR